MIKTAVRCTCSQPSLSARDIIWLGLRLKSESGVIAISFHRNEINWGFKFELLHRIRLLFQNHVSMMALESIYPFSFLLCPLPWKRICNEFERNKWSCWLHKIVCSIWLNHSFLPQSIDHFLNTNRRARKRVSKITWRKVRFVAHSLSRRTISIAVCTTAVENSSLLPRLSLAHWDGEPKSRLRRIEYPFK